MVTKAMFDVKGFEQYFENLAKANQDIDAAAQRALMAGAPILVAEMKELVPKDEHNLENHIQIKGPLRDGNYNYIEVGVIHDSAYTDAETATYGNVQEYGSPSKNIPAHPYIRPAIDYKRAMVLRAQRLSLKAEGLAD